MLLDKCNYSTLNKCLKRVFYILLNYVQNQSAFTQFLTKLFVQTAKCTYYTLKTDYGFRFLLSFLIAFILLIYRLSTWYRLFNKRRPNTFSLSVCYSRRKQHLPATSYVDVMMILWPLVCTSINILRHTYVTTLVDSVAVLFLPLSELPTDDNVRGRLHWFLQPANTVVAAYRIRID